MSLTPAEIADMQAADAEAHLLTAQQQSRGGPEWIVTRTTGNGIDEDVTTSTHTVNPLWVFRYRPKRTVVNGEWIQPDDEWRLNAPAGTNVLPLDQLQSAADAALQFQVMTLDSSEGYVAGVVERIIG